jgi:acetyl-CoA carboxylase biotin carboxyl carrier protein
MDAQHSAQVAAATWPAATCEGWGASMRYFSDDDIRWLAGLLSSEGLAEIEVQEGDESVTLAVAQQPLRPVVQKEEPAWPEVLPKDLIPVLSPMPGIFFRAPSPEAAAYVEVGDSVERGDVIGLIEVMKMFNEVTAPVGGVVAQVAVGNGAQVEQDDTLMLIRHAVQ